MKIKTLLFGGGPGAGCFIDNTNDERDFVGILDNDKAKVGSKMFGLPVYSPVSLDEIDYQEIVITTQWAMAVKSQLVHEFKVPETKIVLPVKNQLKSELPFYCEKSIQLARTIVKQLSQGAIAAQVPLVIDFGTLLGIARDQDIIPWDDDVDFAAPQEYAAEIEALVKSFVSDNPDIDWCIEKVVDGQQLTTSILLKFYSNSDELLVFTSSISFRKNQDEKSIHLPSMGMWYAPKRHFEQHTVINWQGQDIQVPHNYEDYLTFQYDDWNTPKKDIKLTDYAHLQEVGFEQIQTEKRILQKVSKL